MRRAAALRNNALGHGDTRSPAPSNPISLHARHFSPKSQHAIDQPPFSLHAIASPQSGLDHARQLAEELIGLGEASQDPGLLLQAHHSAWTTLFVLGDDCTALVDAPTNCGCNPFSIVKLAFLPKLFQYSIRACNRVYSCSHKSTDSAMAR